MDNQSCTYDRGTYLGENNKKDDLQLDCNFDNGLSDYGRTKMMQEFDNKCFNTKQCSMKIRYSWFNKQCKDRIYYYAAASKYNTFAKERGWHFWKRNAFVREPVLWGVAFCVSDKIYIPFSGG